MNQVMIDLETLGKKAGCIILSIGAVMFDPRGNHYGDMFYANINQQSCRGVGLVEDPDTVAWWSTQSEQSKQILEPNQLPLELALYMFVEWFNRNNGVEVWAQGAAFDFPILEAAFNAVGLQVPWDFWNVRDTRTAYDLFGFDPKTIKRDGIYHYAPDDCKHQIRCVQTAINPMRLGTSNLIEHGT